MKLIFFMNCVIKEHRFKCFIKKGVEYYEIKKIINSINGI